MHACGHDVHTSILLGVAEILNEFKELLGISKEDKKKDDAPKASGLTESKGTSTLFVIAADWSDPGALMSGQTRTGQVLTASAPAAMPRPTRRWTSARRRSSRR